MTIVNNAVLYDSVPCLLIVLPTFQIQKNTTLNCSRLNTVSRPELFNVSLIVFLSLQQVSAGTVHVEEVLNIIGVSNFNAQLFPSRSSCRKDCNDNASTVGGSTYSNSWVATSDMNSLSFRILVQQNKVFRRFHRTFYFRHYLLTSYFSFSL